MNLLPQASGTRPRVACEIMPRGVVAARSAATDAPMAAAVKVSLMDGAVAPGLKPGNIVDRAAVVAAIRQALDQISDRSSTRETALSLVIPDAAVRVLLLDFESLPNRISEALPLVRFRLKKLLPFDADDAMVSYQVMNTARGVVRVLAVAIPRDVLAEYESVTRDAGFEPGAVLSSTLACLAAVDDTEPVLLVNANPSGVTAAIVRAGVLLLHRSVDLQEHSVATATPLAVGLPAAGDLPLVDVHETAGEWAAQEPLPEHGRNPYADQVEAEAALRPVGSGAEVNHAFTGAGAASADLHDVPLSAEIAQAVSVAAAYFEDTLGVAPSQIVSAGSLGADRLRHILTVSGVNDAERMRVSEMVETSEIAVDAVSASTPRSWLSGVAGALRG
jgi:type IV pilus assembly protein PilM